MKAGLLSSPRAGRVIAVLAVGVALVIGGAIAAQSDTSPSLPNSLLPTSHHCEAAQLQAIVDTSAARRTADGTEVPIDFMNQWHEECELRGYTPVTGVAAPGGHDATAVHLPGAITRVVFGMNYTAHIWVLIADAPGGAAAGCRQLTATGLRVSLPSGRIWIPYPFTACARTGQALLSIRPLVRGLANTTSFP
jgi:hypothetical protein